MAASANSVAPRATSARPPTISERVAGASSVSSPKMDSRAVLAEHLSAENDHDLDRILATYAPHPVIELNGARIEGTAAVREFHRAFGFAGSAGSFSDVHVAERHRHETPGAIVIEQTLTARHTGTWRDVAPTGRAIAIAVCTVYVFDEGRLACERVYLDEGRLRHQLTRAAT
jgi:hypothetical protein